ncbi:rhodanese-like domain-containing protein [Streptomyces globisporus]|uniref:rhodanese-like domain-containing protein n=1 Tax=Streptomyces globisporus TaxID=1908 RepID=UPI002093BB3C|nr:hypothetical protein [Streptomyces sp. HB202]
MPAGVGLCRRRSGWRRGLERRLGHERAALTEALDRIQRALAGIRHAADRGDVLIVCASGARSESACRILAENYITAATLGGGTNAWTADGHDLDRPQGAPATWGMERQVRPTAGALVLLGLFLGLLIHPASPAAMPAERTVLPHCAGADRA